MSNGEVTLDAVERRILLDVARNAIGDGLAGAQPRAVGVDGHPPTLCVPAATFVTLQLLGALRGCLGTLEAFQPLVVDAAANAYAAAYRDPRFPPLTAREFECVEIHISILSPPEPLTFRGEDDLIEQLRPGMDGLILSEHGRRGTFLPVVWESVRDPRSFLSQLKVKLGLPPEYWSDSIQVSRYTAIGVP